jgi:hypothetical protein
MLRSEQYDTSADKCDQQAERAPEELREPYLALARQWRQLAATARQQEKQG